MPQHDMVIEGSQSGKIVREDIQAALLALVTNSASDEEPTTTYAHMAWVDTSGADPILKFRNAGNTAWVVIGPINQIAFGLNALASSALEPGVTRAFQPWVDLAGANPIYKIRNKDNDGWITLGRLDLPNLGLLALTGGTISGAVVFSNTDHIQLPVGNTAQRPGAPGNGMMRYNSLLKQFEGYREGNWGAIGGGQYLQQADKLDLADGNTIALSILDGRQIKSVSAVAATTAKLSSTPFGDTSLFSGPVEAILYNLNADRAVIIEKNDANDGCIGNFETIDITPENPVKILILPTARRILVLRGL